MKNSEKILDKYNNLREEIIREIVINVLEHQRLEMSVEFDEPIFIGEGIDEQDNPPVIEEANEVEVIIYHQGNSTDRIKFEHLPTSKLIEVLKGVEESLEKVKEFVTKS